MTNNLTKKINETFDFLFSLDLECNSECDNCDYGVTLKNSDDFVCPIDITLRLLSVKAWKSMYNNL